MSEGVPCLSCDTDNPADAFTCQRCARRLDDDRGVMTLNVAYVRWQRDESRRGRTFPGLPDDHPAVSAIDVLCERPLGEREPVQLLVVGPEDDDDRKRHASGRWYWAVAVVVHERCLARLTDDELGLVVGELVPYEGSPIFAGCVISSC